MNPYSGYPLNPTSNEKVLDSNLFRIAATKMDRIRREIVDGVIRKKMESLETIFEENFTPFTRLKSLEEITNKRLNRIKSFVRNSVLESCSKEIGRLMDDFQNLPVGLALNKYAAIAENLGQRLGKRVEVQLRGSEVEIPLFRFGNLLNALTRVVCNSVEHGLETEAERASLGKSLDGKINIEVTIDNELLKIAFIDDGRGFDVEKIKKSAVENGTISESDAQVTSDREILQLPFDMGFSSRQNPDGSAASQGSLSILGSIVNELNGSIAIRTERWKGTRIDVSVPLNLPAQRTQLSRLK
ncbi:MAG: hypothetical protein GY866_35805 [Proteobacteria bacterium]|nr:hypothetical protein [Pseudomonadota bacterium]